MVKRKLGFFLEKGTYINSIYLKKTNLNVVKFSYRKSKIRCYKFILANVKILANNSPCAHACVYSCMCKSTLKCYCKPIYATMLCIYRSLSVFPYMKF